MRLEMVLLYQQISILEFRVYTLLVPCYLSSYQHRLRINLLFLTCIRNIASIDVRRLTDTVYLEMEAVEV
jgi:hypothetical protein